ncbi:MAG: arsenite methyltransferase [Armatimonadetes bacterium]|nr:arsenite methyltransferase [Armatimonadota bacterium]
MDEKKIRRNIIEAYGRIAMEKEGCVCGCCGSDTRTLAKSLGYSEAELKYIPEEANMGLGCGNPIALASLSEGEIVLDLGSGGGLDCFLASYKVGPAGRVIGVDMTPEMIELAREAAHKNGFTNVEFRLGEIENLPVADESVDVVISNCVINLSTDKPRVFREIYRVLKPGGRMLISDIALMKELPEHIRKSVDAYVACLAGALLVDEYCKIIESSGLTDIKITVNGDSSCVASTTQNPVARRIVDELGETPCCLEDSVFSVYIEAHKYPGDVKI